MRVSRLIIGVVIFISLSASAAASVQALGAWFEAAYASAHVKESLR
jgi:hypothetical protein